MPGVRNLLSSRKCRCFVTASLIGFALAACVLCLTHTSRKGTLVLEWQDASLVVEVFAAGPVSVGDRLFARDQRPNVRYWGDPPSALRAGRCVFFHDSGPGRWETRLSPGKYIVATHKSSRCGYWGGDSYERVEIKEGEHLALTLPRP